MLRKVLIGTGATLGVLIVLFVVFVGPWPTYSSGFEGTKYFEADLARINASAKLNTVTEAPGPLKVGWGVNLITPPVGTSLAGYGARKGAASTGVHDDLYVKALAVSDGTDCAVICGADMLLVPPVVAEAVRAEVAKQTPLTANNILFGASHTHDGPGGWGTGVQMLLTGGKADAKISPFLSAAFTSAIVSAYNSMEPGKIAHGSVEAPDFIRNRAREAAADTELSYLVAKKDSGNQYVLVNFSAHPTTVGSRFLQFTGEFPGALQTYVQKALGFGVECGYLGGALGSSGPRSPEGASDIERAVKMGEALGQIVVDAVKAIPEASWQTRADVNSIGVPLSLPPFQLRISEGWRLSPILAKVIGVSADGWMQAVRIGDMACVGVPADFSGEISIKWKQWASARGIDLWTSSFCGTYVGYISPDEYYHDQSKPILDQYETGVMSWMGPHQEGFFTALMQRMVEGLGPVAAKTAAAPATANVGLK